MKNKIILGDGLLGKFLQKETGWDYISRKKDKIDFCQPESYFHYLEDYDEIVNCIANTDTYSFDRQAHWDTNCKALAELVDYCSKNKKKLIHISTDYIYSNSAENASENDVPVHCANWYGYTKLVGDAYIQLKANNYLLVRTTQKKHPFTYEYAVNQIGNFDYVENIGKIIIQLINKNACGIFNVGTEKKTMFELAKKTKPDVKETEKLYHPTMPKDVSMNINKLKNFLNNETDNIF